MRYRRSTRWDQGWPGVRLRGSSWLPCMLRYSLLSVGEFSDQRYIVTLGNNKCLITDGKRNIVVSGTKNGRLFQVDKNWVALLSTHEWAPAAHTIRGATQPGQSSHQKKLSLQNSQLWHRRLAHTNHTAMESLVDGYTHDDRICETCVLAKHEWKIIRIPVQCTTTRFELVHSNTCGPFATKSIGGATPFIVFIDDFSRYAYVYNLLNKLAGTCTGIFQLFQKKVENWGYNIKRFHCDNGRGEYNTRLFRSILAVGGISFEPAPRYTQHKNGVAERTIGVLTRKVRSLLLDSRAPTEFCAEAICTATNLHARTPNRTVDGKTPYEALHKHKRLATGSDNIADKPSSDKPPLHHLRLFGCVAYKLIPKQQRVDAKMGAGSKKCMMLGYVHNTAKIWKLWDPEQMKVTHCSDVKFDEAMNFHTEERLVLANEKDVLGLPEEEPIYAEDRITLPPALQGHAPALKGHAPAVEHTLDKAVAATAYAPDEVVPAPKWLEPERLEPKSSERLEPEILEPKSSERLVPERLEPEGLRPLSTASGLAPLRRSMRMKTQKSQGNALMADRPGRGATHKTALAAHAS